MRIVFMGTPDFAVPCLSRLLKDGHDVVGVFTQPDKPKGRGYRLLPPPVKALALEKGLPVYQPEKMRDGTARDILLRLAPELLCVVAYGKILPPDILEIPVYGCVNVHGSLLPKYRGAAPIQWSVLNGDEIGGVTTMYMAEGLDCGDIILQRETPIGENETSEELYARLSIIGAAALSETVQLIGQGRAPRTPQEEAQATHAPMLTKEMALIDFSLPAHVVHKRICGFNPWPVAYTALEGKRLRVYRSQCAAGHGEPGEVLDTKRLLVACGDGAVELTEIQTEGGKRMKATDYLRGHPLTGRVHLGAPQENG